MVALFWAGFIVFIVGMLFLDAALLHKKAHAVSMKEATAWTIFWIVLALLFSGFIYYTYEHDWGGIGHGLHGREAVEQYLTALLVEKSLSFDNVFVFAMIFAYFQVPAQLQHKVLFWGILGALVFRGVMIAIGAALIARFDFVMYFFAALLLYAAVKMMFAGDEKFDPNKNMLFRLTKRIFPIHHSYEGERFFITRPDGVRAATPLFLVLLVIESTDILFALDSVPACFGVTRDPFLVFISNIFAIMGLRSLYFVIAAVIEKFWALKYSLVLVLIFIALKMLLEGVLHISTGASLLAVTGLLVFGVVFSFVVKRPASREPQERREREE